MLDPLFAHARNAPVQDVGSTLGAWNRRPRVWLALLAFSSSMIYAVESVKRWMPFFPHVPLFLWMFVS